MNIQLLVRTSAYVKFFHHVGLWVGLFSSISSFFLCLSIETPIFITQMSNMKINNVLLSLSYECNEQIQYVCVCVY